MAEYHPWGELGRRPHIDLHLEPLPESTGGALYHRCGDEALIVIDPRLHRTHRRAALAHELVHDERGGGCRHPEMPDSWAAVVVKEERTVDDIAAARLVPLEELGRFLRARTEANGSVHVWEVAEEFDVPDDVARRALFLLAEGRTG